MSLFTPQQLDLNVPLLTSISRKLNKIITIYDLETTELVGKRYFGITDVAVVHIHPDGTCTQQSALVDPQNPISETASKLTGLTQDMVTGQPTWGQEAMPQFIDWMKHHVFVGFNTVAFDDPGVVSQNVRYGVANTKFEDSRDVRSMNRILTGSAKGTLVALAEKYGLEHNKAHRAIYDVIMTAKVLECILNEYGTDIFHHPGARISANRPVESIFRATFSESDGENTWINQEDRILQITESCGYQSTARLAAMLGMNKYRCTELLDSMIVGGVIDYKIVEDPKAQEWIAERAPYIIEQAWIGSARGKVQPIFEAISTGMKLGLLPEHQGKTSKPAYVSGTQLKVFLKANGYIDALTNSRTYPSSPQIYIPKTPEKDESISPS